MTRRYEKTLGSKLKRHPRLATRLNRVLRETVHAWPEQTDQNPKENQERVAEVKRIFKRLRVRAVLAARDKGNECSA
jgi:hypothetical protein